jgi:hypothetical protein
VGVSALFPTRGLYSEPINSLISFIYLYFKIFFNIVARMWRLYKTGIGLTTGFIGSHTVTHSYSVYTLHSQFTIVLAESSYNYN